jgi:hypothetical protein
VLADLSVDADPLQKFCLPVSTFDFTASSFTPEK